MWEHFNDNWTIVRDHLCQFTYEGDRSFRWARLFLYVLLPLLGAAVLLWYFGPVSSDARGTLLAVLGLLAGVFLGILSVIHSLVGQSGSRTEFNPVDWQLRREAENRLRVLRELYAGVSFNILLLVATLLPLLLLAPAISPTSQPATNTLQCLWTRNGIISLIVYATSISVALSFFEITAGIYLALENHADATARSFKMPPDSAGTQSAGKRNAPQQQPASSDDNDNPSEASTSDGAG